MHIQKTISDILRPLVISGIYKDEKSALKDLVVDFVKKKIEIYASVIRQMESKYGKDFDSITKKMKNKATIEFEDDWMEWKAALLMKEAWHTALKKLLGNAA